MCKVFTSHTVALKAVNKHLLGSSCYALGGKRDELRTEEKVDFFFFCRETESSRVKDLSAKKTPSVLTAHRLSWPRPSFSFISVSAVFEHINTRQNRSDGLLSDQAQTQESVSELKLFASIIL